LELQERVKAKAVCSLNKMKGKKKKKNNCGYGLLIS